MHMMECILKSSKVFIIDSHCEKKKFRKFLIDLTKDLVRVFLTVLQFEICRTFS